MGIPFKMKGFSGFGNSPVKQDVEKGQDKVRPMGGEAKKKKEVLSDKGTMKAYASQTKMKKTGRTLPHPSHTVTPPSKEEAEKSKGTLKGQTGFESDFPIVSKFMKVTNPVSQAKRTIKSGKQIVKGVSKGVKSIKKYFTER